MRMRITTIINQYVSNEIKYQKHHITQLPTNRRKKKKERERRERMKRQPTNLIFYVDVSIGCHQQFHYPNVTLEGSNGKGSGTILKKKGERAK